MAAASVTTVDQSNDSEKLFFDDVDKHISSLHEKYREKTVIKKDTYDKILMALSLEKGKSSQSLSPKFIFWCRNNFLLSKVAGIDVVYCVKSRKPVCLYESFYTVVSECHQNISRGGRHKMLPEIASQYSWIPKFVIEIFLKHYFACQVRKPVKQHVVSKPIISLDVMTRLQIDLVDMRTRLDVVSNDVVYQWILNCINHFSKFSWAYPLQNKSATEVAKCLRGLCYVFGPPRLLHSDNGREFVADVVQELKALFPGMCFVRGRPRHPQSQGCIERTNGVLTGALVVYGTNTRVASATKCTPHEVMFGQKPRCDQEFWKIIQENDIVDEEQLLTPVGGFSDDIVLEGGLVDPDGTTNSTIFIDTETAPDDANIPSLLDVSSTSICTAPILNPLSVAIASPLNDNLISFDSPK
ncbi:unnamed protein product [Didymodactylos carnosus]|uniref:Integrase catalytic domain-containing protein n=1 Tax=Didymodactylos carnosus TaxID=1234261 RepID=A0A8S2NC90_9BILA|nr:unnamed protein product [Didymodactylos carnosus]CAF3996172.1 unnamed protein product [Didymodactylos carnosus]